MKRNTPEQVTGPAFVVYEIERRAYPFSDSIFRIGRDATSDVVVREPAVSRTHAEISREGDIYTLQPQGATGTRVNGTLVTEPQQLRNGDRIEIGTAALTFRINKLPLGVSVVDPTSRHEEEDVMTRRETIANPLLAGKSEAAKAGSRWPVLFLFVLLAAVAAWYFLRP